VADNAPHLLTRTVELACEHGRYDYQRVTGLLRVERLWRREGLRVPPGIRRASALGKPLASSV
jgi:hypothetical protein